jgi:hydrogenase maturation protease
VIVIGVGNRLRRDDGAGPAVIGELENRSLKEVTLAVSDGEPTRLIELWTGADLAIVVDGVLTPSGEPGRIHESDSVTAGGSGTSSHALGPEVAVRLGEVIGRMPARLRIYAIEGADFGFGLGLCPAVAQAVVQVADRITALAEATTR